LALAEFKRYSIKPASRKDTMMQLEIDESTILLEGLDLTWKVTNHSDS
jgi:hypothetical protein